MIRNCLRLIVICFILVSCNSKTYNGYVYDQKTKLPIENVEVNDFLNEKSTKTNNKGYFNLNHDGKISGKLLFKKKGYTSDTLETVSIQNGEKQSEKFKGDTIFLFDVNNSFRDSIQRFNQIQK